MKVDKMIKVIKQGERDLNEDMAIAAWAEVFDRLVIEFIYMPKIEVNDDRFYPSFYPTFYLKNNKTAVIVRGVSFKEDKQHTKESASQLAATLNCDVMICYADGRFRLADYTDHKERVERGESQSDELIYLDDEAMLCACGYCEDWFFCTNTSSWACRNCGHYNGDATAVITHLGSDSIFDFTANLQNHKIMSHRNNGRKTITIRDMVNSKQK